MFYGEVFKALNKAKVKYVVAGGVAVVLHGYRRNTDDLDLIERIPRSLLRGYRPKEELEKPWVSRIKNSIVARIRAAQVLSRANKKVYSNRATTVSGYLAACCGVHSLVLLEKSNLDKFFIALKSAGYAPKVPVTKEQFVDKQQRAKWKKEKGVIVFSFVENDPPCKLIDMFVDEPIVFKDVYKKAVRCKIEGVSVPIMSIDHLIFLKKKRAEAGT